MSDVLTKGEAFLNRKSSLEATIDDEWRNPIERVDACLELAQLLEKDLYQRAKFVQLARDFLRSL